MKKLTKFISILIIILIILSIFLLPRLLKISKIDCQSQYGPCAIDIVNKINSLVGKNYLEAKKQIDLYLKSDTLSMQYSIQYKFPNNLLVSIIERKANYALRDVSKNVSALVDSDGRIIKITPATALPTLEIAQANLNVGETVENSQLFSLEILSKLFSDYQIKEGKIEDDSVVFRLPGGVKAIFPTSGEKDILIGSLKVIIQRLNESSKDSNIYEGKQIEFIDLRFKNPVLK